jgi:hypothetical protein
MIELREQRCANIVFSSSEDWNPSLVRHVGVAGIHGRKLTTEFDADEEKPRH